MRACDHFSDDLGRRVASTRALFCGLAVGALGRVGLQRHSDASPSNKSNRAAVNAPHAADEDARPFAKNPSLAAPRRSQREGHELEGQSISVQWVFDDSDELVPATELNVQVYGNDDVVWYDAIVRKVRKNDVEVFYAADDATRRHNLLVSGEDNYMVRDTRWKLKE